MHRRSLLLAALLLPLSACALKPGDGAESRSEPGEQAQDPGNNRQLQKKRHEPQY